jgi:hypothetical protein
LVYLLARIFSRANVLFALTFYTPAVMMIFLPQLFALVKIKQFGAKGIFVFRLNKVNAASVVVVFNQ